MNSSKKFIDSGKVPVVPKGWNAVPVLAVLAVCAAAFISCEKEGRAPRSYEILTPEEQAWLDKQGRVVRLGPDPNFPPFEFFTESGRYSGITADYMRLVEERLDIEFEIVRKDNWEAVVAGYEEREIDVIGAMTKTRRRQHHMMFTEPYVEVPSVIVARTDEKRTLSLYDLRAREVLVGEGYASHQYLQDNFPYLLIRPVPSMEAGLRMVSTGQAEFMVLHHATYSYVANQLGISNLHIVGNTNHLVRLAIASRKDWPIFNRILGKALATISPEQRKGIYNRWVRIGPANFYESRTFWTALLVAIGTAALIIFLVSVWNRTLKNRVDLRTRELSQVRNYLIDLFNAMPSVLVGINGDGAITQWNRAAEVQTGVGRFDAVGRPFWEVFPFLEKYAERYRDVVEQQTIVENRRETFTNIKNETKFFNICIFPILSDGDRGAVIRLDDVTEMESKEQQLRQAQKMETLGTLASGLAHDFNNVLTAITGSLSLLELKCGDLPADPRRDLGSHIGIMRESARRATDLVEELLTFTSRHDLAFAPVNLNDVMAGVIRMIRNSLDNSIELLVQPHGEPALVSADSSQIEQALINLIINAAHSMTIMRPEGESHGGTLQVSVERTVVDKAMQEARPEAGDRRHFWVLKISDTGVGMDEGTAGQAFEPFFSTKSKSEGTGLGLAMAHNIIQQHEGFIDFSSRKGIGTTFEIFLPVLEQGEAAGPSQPDQGSVTTGSGRVLLVDDEDFVLKTTRDMLEACGYEVIPAEDGQRAVDLFRDRHADLAVVVLDMVMPRKSGKEVYREMKAIDPTVPVILVSGNKQDPRVGETIELGASACIQKPFSLADISRVVQETIRDRNPA